nr:group II intron maturase-specific domain-containing protein [Paenibacillus periandrae]
MGWIGYFRLASAKTHCQSLDQWIRRRLRIVFGHSGNG